MSLPRARSSRSKALNLAACLLAGSLFTLALVAGGKWLMAEHYRNLATNLMADWKAQGTIPLDEWTTAHAAMERAVVLHESRANLHYFLGYLYELRPGAPYANTYLYGRNVSGLHLSLTELSLRYFPQIRGSADIAPLQATHLRNVLGRRNARAHVELMTQYGVLPEVCRMARQGDWTLEAYAARNCSIALGQGAGPLRRG